MAAPQYSWQTSLTRNTNNREDDPRPDLEKQAAVVACLRRRVGQKPLNAQKLIEEMGADAVDLRIDSGVDAMLRRNPRVRVALDDEGEATYVYKAAHDDVHDFESLVQFVEQAKDGVRAVDLYDTYIGAADDVEKAIVAGDVLACFDASIRKVCLFPRGQPYVVGLSNAVRDSRATLQTRRDLRGDVRRGDAVKIAKVSRGAHELIMDRSSVKWFRIDSKVHHSGAQPKRAQRPLSASSLREMHSSNVYVSEYDAQTVPLGVDEEDEDDSDDEYPVHVSLAKHGCTNDVRALWLETAEQTPTDRSLLQRKLAEADLQHGSLQRRPRGKKRKEEEEAKKKRRRVNPKFAKLTNTHLAGTPIGDVLQAALEGRDIEGSATGGARFDVA